MVVISRIPREYCFAGVSKSIEVLIISIDGGYKDRCGGVDQDI